MLRFGITSPALLDRGAELDRASQRLLIASQRLLIDATDQLHPNVSAPGLAPIPISYGGARTRTASAGRRTGRGHWRWAGRLTW
jgi:hypothetical protein